MTPICSAETVAQTVLAAQTRPGCGDSNHTDNIQFEGGSQITVRGNYVHENQGAGTQGITSFDGGTNGVIIENNVVDIPRDWGIEFYSDTNSIIRHNTVVYHAAPYSVFGHATGIIDIDRKTQDPAGVGTHVYDNVAYVGFSSGSTGTQDHNIDPSTVTFVGTVGGVLPTTHDGFLLTAGSAGHNAASDGTNVGIYTATASSSIEVENGTITGNATVITDSNASGGKGVRFGGGSCPSTTPNVPDGPDGFGGCFPGPETTGVPNGTVLSAYTGPCTITADNTQIDSKTVNCNLQIHAKNVQITKSRITGQVWIDDVPTSPSAALVPYSFTISDSEVDAGSQVAGQAPNGNSAIGKDNFTAIRVETTGGIRGIWCEYNCTVKDSWIHGQSSGIKNCTVPGCAIHESAVRMGSRANAAEGQFITHNSLHCEPPDVATNDPLAPTDAAGCSADLTGYGDFAPIQNNTVDKNLFMATTGGTLCVRWFRVVSVRNRTPISES